MSITPKVIPPIQGDINAAPAINQALAPLCQQSHIHVIYSTPPTARDGMNGDIATNTDGTALYIKGNNAWKTVALTAL